MIYLFAFFISLLSTLFLTPLFINFMRKFNIVDIPGGRRINDHIVPRMGGLIIFMVVLIVMNSFTSGIQSINLLIYGISIIMFCGIIDDVMGLKSYVKLVFQTATALFFYIYFRDEFSSLELFGITVPEFAEIWIFLIFTVGIINSINLMDGLDGLASGFSLMVFSILLALAVIQKDSFLIFLTASLVGSLLGFLRFNAFPASIFLGDTGSLVLGSYIVITCLMTSINYGSDGVLDLSFPIILLAVPVTDTIKVFIYRIWKKRNPFSADTNHLHHIILFSKVKHEVTVFLIEIFNLAFVILSLLYIRGIRGWVIAVFLFLASLLIVIKPLLKYFQKSEHLFSIYKKLRSFPIRHIMKIASTLIILTSFLTMVIIISSFSLNTALKQNDLLFLILICFALLGLTYMQQKKTNKIIQINFFLNLTIFFIISKMSLPLSKIEFLGTIDLDKIMEICFYFLSVLISVFLLIRWKTSDSKKIFFSGIDLTMIVFMLMVFIANKILAFDSSYSIIESLLEAFILYIWYKVLVEFRKDIEKYLSYVSYGVPILSLIILLMMK